MSWEMRAKKKNVNNDRLFQKIDDFLMEVFAFDDIRWGDARHRAQLAELVDDYLNEVAEETDMITLFDVICDRRNNSATSLNENRVHFTVKYKQKNCMNYTEIQYTFTKKS